MRAYLFLLSFLALLIAGKTQAQDIIMLMSGDEVKAKVKEVTLTEIIYRHPDSLQQANRSVPKTQVFMIKYANGAKELMKPSGSEESTSTVIRTPQQLYEQGRQDARKYYKARGVFWGSAAAGFGSFLTAGVSLVVPVVLAAVPPDTRKMDLPDLKLQQDQAYLRGYQKQAHKRKIGNALAGTGTGVLAGTVATVALAFAVMAAQ